jgi:hypothetical protein
MPPQSSTEDVTNHGTWLSTQRYLEKIGELDSNRQKLLDEFGFKWVRQVKAPLSTGLRMGKKAYRLSCGKQ